MNPSSLVVVERELLRASRRWQTFAIRAGFAGILFAFVALFWTAQVSRDVSWRSGELARAGQKIFMAWTWLQLILLSLITPIVIAQGIVEEKTAGTLELLATTRLTPWKVLWGKLLSRLLTIEALILAGLPVLAVCLSLGGVEPVQVVNAVLQANAAVLCLGSVAAFGALYARGPILPSMLAWGWAFGAWIFGPLPLGWAVENDAAMAALSPTWALAEGRGPEILGPIVVWGVIAIAVVALAARIFSAMAGSHGPDQEELSADVWTVERFKRYVGLLAGLLVLAVPLLVMLYGASHRSRVVPWELFLLCMWGWNALVLLIATLGYLLVCRWAFRQLAVRRRERRSWKQVVEGWSAAEGTVGAHVRAVFGHPVIWRETRTAAHGALTRHLGKAYIALFLALLGLALIIPRSSIRELSEPAAFFSFVAFFVAGLGVVLVTTSSIAGEKAAGTLDLLRVTSLTPGGLLRGKLAATALLVGPIAAVGVALYMNGCLIHANDWRWDWYDPVTPASTLAVRWAAVSVWGLAALTFLAVCTQAIALKASTPIRAWVGTLGFAFILAVVPTIAYGFCMAMRFEDVAELFGFFNPAFSEYFWQRPAVPSTIWTSSALWLLLGAIVHLLSVRRLASRATVR